MKGPTEHGRNLGDVTNGKKRRQHHCYSVPGESREGGSKCVGKKKKCIGEVTISGGGRKAGVQKKRKNSRKSGKESKGKKFIEFILRRKPQKMKRELGKRSLAITERSGRCVGREKTRLQVMES